MGIGGLLRIMWRRKLVVVLVAALVLGGAAGSLSMQHEVFESKAKVALLPDPANPTLVPFYGEAVSNLLPTYAQTVKSRTFLDSVAQQLPFQTTGAKLDDHVRAVPVSGVGILSIIASAGDAQRAQQIAHAAAETFVSRLTSNGIVTVSLLDDARVPLEPSSPKPKLVYAIGVLLGLLLGALAAVGWDRYFVRITTAAELQTVVGMNVLAVLPEVRRLRERGVVLGDESLGDLEESLRNLRTNVFFSAADLSKGTTIITGISPGDGKSTVAANLAVMTAELGVSVVLVDADVHRPVQHEIFGLSNDRGLSSTVLANVPIEQLAVPTRYPNLKVVPAGPPLRSRAEELRLYLEALPQCASLAEVVLVDSPPIGAADEVRVLAAFSTRVVLLVRAGSVTARQVKQAVDGLKIVDATLLGVVLSRAKKQEITESIRYYRDYRNYREQGPEPTDQPPPSPELEPHPIAPTSPTDATVRDDLPR